MNAISTALTYMAELLPITTNVERVRQDNFKYCAPACLQMLLATFGIPKSQDEIWNESRALMTDAARWFTDPDAVSAYVRNTLVVGFGIDDNSNADATTSIKCLVSDLAHRRLPTPILISGGRHWVLVSGVQASFNDTARTDALVSGLYVADPSRGSSGIEFKPIGRTFFQDYFSPVMIQGAWNGNLVSVSESGHIPVQNLEIIQPSRPEGGGVDVTVEEAVELATEDVAYFGLGNVAITPFSPGLMADVFVQRQPFRVNVIDGGASDNYVVSPLVLDDETLIWTIFSNAAIELESALFTDDLKYPPDGEALRNLLNSRLQIAEFTVRPGLWWKPCMELPSKFDFVRIVDSARGSVYVDARNNTFTALNENPVPNWLAG